MNIIDYFTDARQPHWLNQIRSCDWGAGKYLTYLLESGTFHRTVGEKSALLLLTDGDALVSFATYAERDCVKDTDLSPWVGFVYTWPEYRGRRCMGRLIEHIAAAAHRDGHPALYVCTDHIGLYEKYGFTYVADMPCISGDTGRVLKRELTGNDS